MEITGGISLDVAMKTFVSACNKRDTLILASEQLIPRVKRLRRLLLDPLTQEQARILVEVITQEKPIDDVIEWLQAGGMSWHEFVQQKSTREEQVHQQLVAEHAAWLANLRARERPTCTKCRLADSVVPIVYGLPQKHVLLFHDDGEYVLGGFPNSARWYCNKCDRHFR